MHRVEALAAFDRALLRAYSRATAERLSAYLPVRLAMSWLDRFLAANVAKEVAKDALTIRRAGLALAAGAPPGEADLDAILAAGRDIDRAFLRAVAGLPVEILIHYEEIEPIRRRRVASQLQAAYRILDAWRDAPNGRAALRKAYAKPELERLLRDLMALYGQETQALSRSLRLPPWLTPLRDPLVRSLVETMNEAAHAVAEQAVAAVHRRAPAAT